jgi:RNA polymerase sigma-70 factor (ECF subfamily)
MDDLDCHLDAIASGDPDVFGRWVAAVEPSLRASLMRFAAQVDVEAVLQEALLRVWQVAPRVERDGAPNSLLRFAQRVARNLAIDLARRQRPELSSFANELVEEASSDAPSPPDPLLRELLRECQRRLPKKPASALESRLLFGAREPDRTLARRLHMTTNTFLQNVTRARKLLLECMKKRGVDLEAELA